ncbi:MAG TPA: site-specific DNA-methyltransferase [Caldilineaceae bacterium]|nr:site-specific DNA-methyltransferase [Caldilineaceae bacterium]
MKKTTTSTFGVGRRESHDASAFYARQLHQSPLDQSPLQQSTVPEEQKDANSGAATTPLSVPPKARAAWADRIYCASAERMGAIPDGSVALAFTSPPYNVGKDYEGDLSMEGYLALIETIAAEVYRVLLPGGRFVVNIANLGRKPYIPLHAYFYQIHQRVGFQPMGEVIWQKARGASGSCAWGSWQSAKAPRLRDVHEYLLVFAKEHFSRPDKGQSDIARDEFMAATLSIWEIPAESAKRVGHPAPFPVALAERVIRLYSYVDDVVLDPFMGSGTTAVAAIQNQRHYVGYDLSPEYCTLAEARIAAAQIP